MRSIARWYRDRWVRRAAAGRSALAVGACLVVPAFVVEACGSGQVLETRTFELQYMNPEEAVEMVTPYVYADRRGAPGAVTHFSSGITVRETPEILDRIADVLARYDRAKPGVRLHFQIIEADGFTDADPRIAEVRSALEELFRFDGYRLVTETQLALMEATSSEQYVSEGERRFLLGGRVEEVRGSGARASVTLAVHLREESTSLGQISTTMAVPVGKTVVLGSTKPPGQPTMILTVRPELVPLPDAAAGS